ncbi:DNA-J protein, putative [Bodo saltans]|uniref:DNA-J protein, putative n=1 Tax=Bodo saltans TaxID=75058 RepID=A0A0S4JH45_BODSA|nr:DNA-J protein, putative [Bodo saltans]|eukprot:CUG89438.1 DNA-J protein, putative [Bodo saltans]
MDIHTHFHALDLRRGASESDMRKAYHRKALELHPDRNPTGADAFKRVHSAYEALQKHYKSHGGVDFASTARNFSASSEPLFSEEELFRDSTSDPPRRYPHRPFRQSSSPSGPPMFGNTNAQTAQHHAQAHKGRVPVSGYDPFNGDADSMEGFMSQSKHFADMEQRKARLARSSTAEEPATSKRPSDSPRRAPTHHSPNYTPCHQQLSDEWKAQRENAAEIERARVAMEESERQSRKAQLERETREEWNRMTAEMEAKSAADAARTAHQEAVQRLHKQEETNTQLRELQVERRNLKKELFRRRMPAAGEVDRMTAQELVLMQQVLEDALDMVGRKLREALRPTALCCACGVTKKDNSIKRFGCAHMDTCVDCGRKCLGCPVCGSDNLDLMSDS